jgi:poly-beta-1,6-N-acetyl-D-glucosamine synthase
MPSDAILALWSLDGAAIMVMFWHALIFEVPRFTLATTLVGAVAALRPDRFPRDAGRHPTLSIVMAGHNEGKNHAGKTLRRTILGLKEQTRKDFQIVVVDDGSTDDMSEVGQRLREEGLIDVFLTSGRRGGKVAAINLGLTQCTGEIVMNVDIDTSFDRDAIERMLEPFADPDVGAVSGNIAVRNHDASIVSRFQTIQYLISISLGRRVTDLLGTLFIVSGAFGAFRRRAIDQVGSFDMGPGEDADITIKLRQAGWKVRFQPHAWALTDVPETAMALFRQRLRWNRSLVRIRIRKYGQILNPLRANFSLLDALGTLDIIFFQAILPISFYIYLLWLLATFGGGALLILLTVTTVYIVAELVTFVVAVSVSEHYGRLRLLPYVFGYALFNAYLLRAVSVYSYLQELIFRSSYRDPYVPSRVLNSGDRF